VCLRVYINVYTTFLCLYISVYVTCINVRTCVRIYEKRPESKKRPQVAASSSGRAGDAHPFCRSQWSAGLCFLGWLCMCVCVCVCMYVCMYVCTYVCIYVCMYVFMYLRMYVCMCVCMYVHMCVCMYVYNVFHLSTDVRSRQSRTSTHGLLHCMKP
jgi:hypothetical protein